MFSSCGLLLIEAVGLRLLMGIGKFYGKSQSWNIPSWNSSRTRWLGMVHCKYHEGWKGT